MFWGLFAEYCFSNVDETKNNVKLTSHVLQSLLERVHGMGVGIANAEVKLRFIALLVCLIIFSNFSMLVQEMLFFIFFCFPTTFAASF